MEGCLPSPDMKLHEKIRRLAKSRNLRARELSLQIAPLMEKAGKEAPSESTVRRFMDGKSIPDIFESVALAKVLSVTVEFLVDETSDEPPGPIDEHLRQLLESAKRIGYDVALERIDHPAIIRTRDDERGPGWKRPGQK